jgi:L-lactate dehydrogenase complex protein LldG
MTTGTIHNRKKFINKLAENLGREQRTAGVTRPEWKHQPQWEVFRDLSQDELVDVLKKQCTKIQTDFVGTTSEELVSILKKIVANYGGGPVITWNDKRFAEFGLSGLLNEEWPHEQIEVNVWDPSIGDKNIERAERANVGITFSDQTLAESGTVVLFSDNGKGRSVSLLPTTYIAIIPKSTIVPRITQAADEIHKKINNGEDVASCVNFITGPSNSADIEMNLVVGVHGPIKATYIVVSDK